jgi:hypothetical protein
MASTINGTVVASESPIAQPMQRLLQRSKIYEFGKQRIAASAV